MDQVEFAERNIEELSDLYRAISKIPWTPGFRMPKFQDFVIESTRMMVRPTKKKKETPALAVADWVDFEGEQHLQGNEDFEKKM